MIRSIALVLALSVCAVAKPVKSTLDIPGMT